MTCTACEPSADPRHRDTCLKCGRPISVKDIGKDNSRAVSVLPSQLPDRVPPRHPALERDLTEQAARLAGVDPHPIIRMAEVRTLPGPVRNLATRRFDVEAHEEAADARNYLCWWIEQLQLTRPEDDILPLAAHHITLAHAAFVTAFNEITRAAHLLRE